MEYHWFRRFSRATWTCRGLFKSPEDRDLDFNGAVADPAVVAEAWESWRARGRPRPRGLRAATTTSAAARASDGDQSELREIIVHMIEEYARHVGHADLLRERIDGRTGQ